MSEKYFIDYAINGTAEIEADSAEEAASKFETMDTRELAEIGAVEVLGDPETKEQRESYWEQWKAENFPKTEAANG